MNRLIESLGTARHASERVEMAPGGKISGVSRQTVHLSKCGDCGASYAKKRRHQIFCSPKCRKAFWLKDRTVHPEHDIRIKLDAILVRLKQIEAKIGIGKEGS